MWVEDRRLAVRGDKVKGEVGGEPAPQRAMIMRISFFRNLDMNIMLQGVLPSETV
jgi:hypothetical protein